jgi:ubiquinone/menaquinone biosynthesis C-methylase UbiE
MSEANFQSAGWQLGGDAPVAYDTYIVNVFMQDYSRRLVETAEIRAGARVLDVACGTGVVTRLAAERAGAEGYVVGLDINTGMLSRARALSEKSNIAWHEGGVTDMPFSEGSFDVVLCQQGLQFFPDKAAALADMRRVLTPGGRLVVSVWRPLDFCPWQRAIGDAVERHVGLEAGKQIRSAFSLGDANMLRRTIDSAGFRDVEIKVECETIRHPSLEEYVPGYLSATPVAGAVATLNAEAQSEIVAAVRHALAECVVDHGVVAPIQSHVAIAYR